MTVAYEPHGPWQRPDYEAHDIFPGFACWDKRQRGSITISRSRLAVWAIIGELVQGGGWEAVEDNYQPGCSAEELSAFLYDLLEARGEFGRLLLELANAQRLETERETRDFDDHFSEAHPGEDVCDCGRPSLPEWWKDNELAAPVIEQLRRCLEVFDNEVVTEAGTAGLGGER